MWRSKDSLKALALSSHHVHSWGLTSGHHALQEGSFPAEYTVALSILS